MKPRWIAVMIVVLLVAFVAYTMYAKDTVDVKVGDYGKVKAEIEVEYTDGTIKTLTRVKTAETGMVKHNNTNVKKFTISIAYEPNTGLGKNVRVLCDKADMEHMTTLTIKGKNQASEQTADVAVYPLSLSVKSDYKTVGTGAYTTIWSDIEVTALELEAASGIWALGTNSLVFVVKVWINIDKDSDQVEGFTVDYRVPFTVLTFLVDDISKKDIDSATDPNKISNDPVPFSSDKKALKSWVVGTNVKFDQKVKTKVSILDTDTSKTATWKGFSGGFGGGGGFSK